LAVGLGAFYFARTARPPAASEPAVPLRVRGRIRAVAPPPAGESPYREALGALAVELPDGPAVVYVRVWHEGAPTALARLRAGQEVELALEPWAAVAAALDSVQRFELAGEAWWTWPVYWAGEVR
ncbi:MAG TPA: hypothetical protein PKM64_06395, partial [Thermoanaerobaculia bacterium]|nr:hypothetical protein [Thermoanaerobaculia bacterium]